MCTHDLSRAASLRTIESMVSREYVLLFDRDCGICSAFTRWIHALDLRRRVRLQTIQSSRDLLRGIPEDRVLDAFHMISPDGRVRTGGDAVPLLIQALPMGEGIARVVNESPDLMSRVHVLYEFLTRFRDRLVCRVEPAGTSAGSAR
jgi:predicted DCC family thiol-disulfide oxidoreductase YuxK